MLNILLKNGKDIEGRHNLKQILQTVRSKVKLYNGGISSRDFKYATKELDAYINELYEKIESTPKNDKMDFSRYPVSHDNEEHFYVELYGTVDVDLENLILVLETIRQKVDDLAAFIYYEELQQDFGKVC